MNNLTEEEKRQAEKFINDSGEDPTNLGDGKRIEHPVIKSRLREAVIEHGSVAIEVVNIICYGSPKDGHNNRIESTKLLNLTKELMKGGK